MQACISPSGPALPPGVHYETVPHSCSPPSAPAALHRHQSTIQVMTRLHGATGPVLPLVSTGVSVRAPTRLKTFCDVEAVKQVCAGAGAPLQDRLDRGRAQNSLHLCLLSSSVAYLLQAQGAHSPAHSSACRRQHTSEESQQHRHLSWQGHPAVPCTHTTGAAQGLRT